MLLAHGRSRGTVAPSAAPNSENAWQHYSSELEAEAERERQDTQRQQQESQAGDRTGFERAALLRVEERVSHVFKLSWRLPSTRDAMAHASNLTFAPSLGMMSRSKIIAAELDLLKDQLEVVQAAQPSHKRTDNLSQKRELEMLARIVARVRKRYEGQMWGPQSSDEDTDHDDDNEENAQDEDKVEDEPGARCDEDEAKDDGGDAGAAVAAHSVHAAAARLARTREQCFMRFGNIAVLCIEPFDDAFASSGETHSASRPMISEEQWQFIEKCLMRDQGRSDELGTNLAGSGVRTLIVLSRSPFLWDPPMRGHGGKLSPNATCSISPSAT